MRDGRQDQPVVWAIMKVMAMASKTPQIELCSRMTTGTRQQNHRLRVDTTSTATDAFIVHDGLRLQMEVRRSRRA